MIALTSVHLAQADLEYPVSILTLCNLRQLMPYGFREIFRYATTDERAL